MSTRMGCWRSASRAAGTIGSRSSRSRSKDLPDGTRERVDRLVEWHEETVERVPAARIVGVSERVAGELIGSPVLRAPQVARRHGMSPQGAMKGLRRLADLGIVEERHRDGRVSFAVPAVIELLSR